jgi:hypothetical protein
MMNDNEDRFAYYVPQTPRDSSRRNSFFLRSSPVTSKRLIITLHDGLSSIIGRGQDADPPLQQRVITLETTLQSVHTAVNTLETTLGEIVTLLRAAPTPKPQEFKPTPVSKYVPKKVPLASSNVSAVIQDRNPHNPATTPSYRDTAQQKMLPVVPDSTPAPCVDYAPMVPLVTPRMSTLILNHPWSRGTVVVKIISPAITGTAVNSTFTMAKVTRASKLHGSTTTSMDHTKGNRINFKSSPCNSPMTPPNPFYASTQQLDLALALVDTTRSFFRHSQRHALALMSTTLPLSAKRWRSTNHQRNIGRHITIL